eukprot:scaffold3013_cov59-Phaeocystis_antarctica.AAC.8
MGRPGPQVNFQFSVKPEGGLKIDGYDVFEDGVKIENPPEHEPYKGSASPLQYFASATLYDLFYISQTLHGPIHVLHYVRPRPPLAPTPTSHTLAHTLALPLTPTLTPT